MSSWRSRCCCVGVSGIGFAFAFISHSSDSKARSGCPCSIGTSSCETLPASAVSGNGSATATSDDDAASTLLYRRHLHRRKIQLTHSRMACHRRHVTREKLLEIAGWWWHRLSNQVIVTRAGKHNRCPHSRDTRNWKQHT